MELWDGYFRNGSLADIDLVRGEDIPKDLYHLVCEVLVRHIDGDYLLMERSYDKVNYPGLFEATAGGSALKGENRYECVKRELLEETGLEGFDFKEINYTISDKSHCLFYSFVCTTDCSKDSVTLLEGETIAYRWVSESEFIEFLRSDRVIERQKLRYIKYFKGLGYVGLEDKILWEDIENSQGWLSVSKINKGWSKDSKYVVTTENNIYSLRISNIEFYEKKKREYEIINKIAKTGINMSFPLDFGICNRGESVYMLLSWVSGCDLEKIIERISEDRQRKIGRDAGIILKKIHGVPIDEKEEINIIDKKLKQLEIYENSNVRIENDEDIIDFVKNNINVLKGRYKVLLHGDFHPGNLIYTPTGEIGVIDFNRRKYGDAYEDFYKLQHFAKSRIYASEQIKAYFNDNIPDEFWRSMAVYVAHTLLWSIKWAEDFGKDEVEKMKKLAKIGIKEYDGFKSCIPKWFKQ